MARTSYTNHASQRHLFLSAIRGDGSESVKSEDDSNKNRNETCINNNKKYSNSGNCDRRYSNNEAHNDNVANIKDVTGLVSVKNKGDKHRSKNTDSNQLVISVAHL